MKQRSSVWGTNCSTSDLTTRMASSTSTMFLDGKCTVPAIAPAVPEGERGVRAVKSV